MRKPLLIGAALVLLTVFIVAVLVVFKPFSPHTPTSASTGSPTPATSQIVHTTLPSSDVTFLQEHMDSPDVTTQSLAWIPGLRTDYVASVTNPLPAGTKLVIDAKTFWYAKDYGEVTATVGNTTYILHLERFSGQWFIAWTTAK